jgi:integrase
MRQPNRRPVGTGSVFRGPGRQRWTIQYYQDGRRIREATGLTSKRKAQDLLNERLRQVSRGELDPREQRPARMEELYLLLETHVKVNRPRSLRDLRGRWRHLQPVFGFVLAAKVTTDSIMRYAAQRKGEGAANATVNRELATLRRAFNLGRRATPPRVRQVPYIPMLREDNVRRGFVEDSEFSRLAAEAQELWLRALLEVGFTYGWRRGELLGLRVRQVNLAARTIRLDVGTTKNREGREVAMTTRVEALLGELIASKRPDDFVFTRAHGKPVKDFRKAWRKLCARAGLGVFTCRACAQPVPGGGKCKECGAARPAYRGLIVHDLRRSAAKALRAAGVPESVIMAAGGWKTPAMFRRYAIVSSADQRAAVERLEQARAQNSPQIALISPKTTSAPASNKINKVQ